MTQHTAADEERARTDWLLHLPPDQIAQYGFETICDWLLACQEQRCAHLRKALAELRASLDAAAAAHERLARALTPPA